MTHPRFQIGFWHPFGPHGEECAEQILDRKRAEIVRRGWTLWSFQRRKEDTLIAWHREIEAIAPGAVYVFCSNGKGAVDPPHTPIHCRSYRLVGQSAWKPLPKGIRVPHPFRAGHEEASAFVVKRVLPPDGVFKPYPDGLVKS